LIRLAVRVRREQAELVLAELLTLAPSGVEEVDLGADVVEYAIYGAPGELPDLPDVRAAAGGALVDVSTREIADDWSERWRSFHRPLVLGDRLVVRPPWEPVSNAALDVVIDPGQAFGTGAHATTRLCLELMLETAAKLGWSPVLALDYDPAAVEATRENAEINGVDLKVSRFDLRREQVPDADFVAANVLAGPLVTWAASQRQLPPDLILSGLLATEADRVSEAYAQRGFVERDRRTRGEWSALALAARPGAPECEIGPGTEVFRARDARITPPRSVTLGFRGSQSTPPLTGPTGL
jgi:ribosomal protein L11 methyltransferase